MREQVKEAIRKAMEGRALFDAPVAPFTTYRIGGPADAILFPAGRDELASVARILADAGETLYPLGKGSKLLVRDGGFRGALVSLTEGLAEIEVEEEGFEIVRARAGAGAYMPALAEWSARRGLAGVEWGQGIPGSVGGAALMNAGAWGGKMSDAVAWIETFDWRSGERLRLVRADLAHRFRYRALDLDPGLVVLEAGLDLKGEDPEAIAARIRANRDKRKGDQPLEMPNAGSVFKNPPGVKAGRLIEEAGMKGARRGDAAVSDKHANFILNLGAARAADVLALAEEVASAVRRTHEVDLELELRVIGVD